MVQAQTGTTDFPQIWIEYVSGIVSGKYDQVWIFHRSCGST
jgi:hypothetical protein